VDLVSKLNTEIAIFTLLQFISALVGFIAALYFYTTKQFLPAMLVTMLAIGIIGFCNFNIHRNGEYLEKSADVSQAIRRYEEEKRRHATTVPVMVATMATFGLLLLGVWGFSYAAAFPSYSSVWGIIWFRIGMPLLLALIGLFAAFSQHWGRSGWDNI
jgi:hypothetical protein